MSYCKVGPDSDVYAWSDGKEWRVEFDGLKVVSPTAAKFIQVLRLLRNSGHRVPDGVFNRLAAETLGSHLTAAKAEAATQGSKT